MLRVVALGALAALAGCTVKDSCADGTVLVALTLNGDSAQADELVVDIALDGDAPRESTLTHTPGVAGGNVLVKFPSGYPRGHTVAVTIAARTAGVVVGNGAGSIVLAGGCEVLSLDVAAGGVDGGGGDDLSTPDDMTTASPDMVCVPTTENCFNGIDDDCDGHTDCDDPDCTPVAVCVPPVTGTFVVGTTLATASLCPTAYTSLEVINTGLSAAANCSSGCSCGNTCIDSLYHFGSAAGNCPNTDNENSFSQVSNVVCHNWNSGQWDNTLDVHQLSTPASCLASGTAIVPTESWAASKRVCSTPSHGGGCSGGNWCVPISPGPNCEVAAGSATCDTGYNAVSGPWYTGYTDNRNCSCTCGAPTGSCGSQVTLYTDANCMTGAAQFAANASNNINCSVGTQYLSARINATLTCGSPTYTPNGALTSTGLQTLCCAP